MLIDWFTVVAQLFNFLILVWLLQRILYRPIIKTIKSRQAEIDRRWHQAEEQKQIAELEAASYQHSKQQLEQTRREMLTQAQAEAKQEYYNLLEQARQNVTQQQADWKNAIARQQEQFLENLQQKITEQVFQIARQALRELADVSLEQKAIANFIARLENLDQQKQQFLAESLNKSNDGVIIRSSFHLPAATREKILNSLRQRQIYQGDNVRFTTKSDLICGIELQTRDYKVTWNLESYLQSLEQNLVEDFSKETKNIK